MLNARFSRRDTFKLGALALAAMAFPLAGESLAATNATQPFTLPPLPYPTNALQPIIGDETMKLHHGKHHQAYIDKLNKALEGQTKYNSWTIEDLLKKLDQLPEGIRTAVRNNGGGHYNHTMFWETMAPPEKAKATKPAAALQAAIDKDFGSMDNFKAAFEKAGADLFGSGWVWLAMEPKSGKLAIRTTPNQDSLLLSGNDVALFGNDVWEHAYYLDHRNKRPEYLKAWWGVLNWDTVNKRFSAAGK